VLAADTNCLDVPLEEQPLAGVRSSSLFALMRGWWERAPRPLEAPVRIVDAERGFPEDASARLRAVYDGWARAGAHSAGHVSLRELEEFPWDAHELVFETFYDWENLLAYRRGLSAQGLGDRREVERLGLRIVSEAELIALGKKPARAHCAGVRTSQTYANLGAQLLGLVPVMKRLGGPDQVRLVFWFDS
jgi:hypothetical protein